jgi:bacillithiol biosynthesis cysteine-adding enzyme BshC
LATLLLAAKPPCIIAMPMDSHCISFREVPHTSRLFSSFLYDFQPVSQYYAHPPTEHGLDAAAKEVRLDPGVRQGVVEVLREQNRAFGNYIGETEKNLQRLADGAVAIVTGQQVGLFGGPAYSIYKALSAIRCAADLTLRGIDAVPVFWLATEDHDLAEVNHCFLNTRQGLTRYELPAKEQDAGHRVGEVRLGGEILGVVGAVVEAIEGESSEDVIRALRESYTPGETYSSAFGKLMARLLGDRGIIFIDPLDERLHRFALPVFLRAAEDAEALRDALLARSKDLDSKGFHAQVKVTRETTLLFYNQDGRRMPVRSHDGKFVIGKQTVSRDELLGLIEKNPENVTPNALLRPLVQDSLLPTAAYIGGPAEVAYFAQSQVAYEKILGRMPAILPRASFTIVEPAVAGLLERYRLNLSDLLLGRQNVRLKLEQRSLPEGLAKRFESDERELRGLLDAYTESFGVLDQSLLGTLRSAERKMLHQFTKLKTKAGRAEGLRNGVLDRHERILLDSLCPQKELQERSLSLLPLLANYGPSLLDNLTELSVTAGTGQGSESDCAFQHHVAFI